MMRNSPRCWCIYTPASTTADCREWPLGSRSAATSPCSTIKGEGGRREEEGEGGAGAPACMQTRAHSARPGPPHGCRSLAIAAQHHRQCWCGCSRAPLAHREGREPAWSTLPRRPRQPLLACGTTPSALCGLYARPPHFMNL